MTELMKRITDYIRAEHLPVYSVAIRGDKIEPECARLVSTNRCQDSYSVAKAFAMTAFGIAFGRGLIRPEDKITQVLRDFVPENIDPAWHEATFHHALTHTLGLPGSFLDIDCHDPRSFGQDYLKYTLGTKLIFAPGTDYAYTDAAFYLISRAAEQVTGEPIDNLLWREIGVPMEFTEFAWSRCPMGHPMGATGLYATDEDVVKLGELYRCGGMWNGQRLLDGEWVKLVLERGYELRSVGVPGVVGKGGMYGQMLCIFIDKGFSLSWHGYGDWNMQKLIRAVDEAAK